MKKLQDLVAKLEDVLNTRRQTAAARADLRARLEQTTSETSNVKSEIQAVEHLVMRLREIIDQKNTQLLEIEKNLKSREVQDKVQSWAEARVRGDIEKTLKLIQRNTAKTDFKNKTP